MHGDRTPSLNPYLRRPWTQGRIGGRTRRGALILLAAVVGYLFFFGEAGWINQARLERRKKALQAEIAAMERHRGYLADEAQRLESDPEYQEKYARENYGYTEEDETIYHLRYVQ